MLRPTDQLGPGYIVTQVIMNKHKSKEAKKVMKAIYIVPNIRTDGLSILVILLYLIPLRFLCIDAVSYSLTYSVHSSY